MMSNPLPLSINKFIREQIIYAEQEIAKHPSERNMFPNNTDATLAVNCLWEIFFSGEYIAAPIGSEQFNTIFLHRMLMKFYKPYRKAMKKWRKQHHD